MLATLGLHGLLLVGFLGFYLRWLDQEIIADVCLYGLLVETLLVCGLTRYLHTLDAVCFLHPGSVLVQFYFGRIESLFCFDPLSGFFTTILLVALCACFFFLVEYFEYDSAASTIMFLSALFSQVALLYFCAFDLSLVIFFWELISLISFLLVQHWAFRIHSYKAGLRVFIISQVGDFFFFMALFLVLGRFQTTSLPEVLMLAPLVIFEYVLWGGVLLHYLSLVSLGLYIALFLKAAQWLFYPWLLDAMEAPVPISAQLHSSTLVVIGFYLIFRFQPLLLLAPGLGQGVASMGLVTCVGASLLGFFQEDGKKLLACSTAGQLGYVTMAVGLQLYGEALLLLTFCCCNKAVTFIWFGLIMQRAAGVSDFRRLAGVRLFWCEHAGLLISLSNFTVLPGLFVWHVKGLFLGGQLLLNTPLAVVVLGTLGLTWFFSSLYLGYLYLMLFFGPQRLGCVERGVRGSLTLWLNSYAAKWAQGVGISGWRGMVVRPVLLVSQALLMWHGGAWGLTLCDLTWVGVFGSFSLGYF